MGGFRSGFLGVVDRRFRGLLGACGGLLSPLNSGTLPDMKGMFSAVRQLNDYGMGGGVQPRNHADQIAVTLLDGAGRPAHAITM